MKNTQVPNSLSLFITVLLALTVSGCQPAPTTATNGPSAEVWTGFLEGETVDVSAEVGGRITAIAVEEGDRVEEGQLLVSIADDLIRLKTEAADADVAAAETQVALLTTGARPEDVRRGEARVDQARAALVAATQSLTNTEAIRANPQTLLIMQAEAQGRAEVANDQYNSAVRMAEAADIENRLWEEQVRMLWDGADITLPDGTKRHFSAPSNRQSFAQNEWNKASHNAWLAWAAVDQAKADADTAAASARDISDQLTNRITLDARVDVSRGTRDNAAAALESAQAALQVLEEGASPAQVQAARAELEQRRAARAALDHDLAHYRVNAPRGGTVDRVMCRAGEVVASAQPLVQLRVEGDLTLRVFVAMSSLDQVRLGAPTAIWVTELGTQTFPGTVTRIADSAEFTGRQAQTDSERNAQLVAVEVTIKNPDAQLKAGMPASVSFGSQSEGAIRLVSTAALNLATDVLTLSGTLEARQTRIASEVEGRVISVAVKEGDIVNPNEALIMLDDSDIRSNLNEAEAGLRAAQSKLDEIEEKAQPGTLSLARAGVTLAQSQLDAAIQALDDANRALGSVQELTSQVHIWEGKVESAKSEITGAEAALSALKAQVAVAGNDQSSAGKGSFAMLQKQQEGAEADLRAAQANLKSSQHVLDLYREVMKNPLDLLAARDGAADQVQVAQADLEVAQAELEIAQRGPQPEAVALATAGVRAAEVSLATIKAQSNRYTLESAPGGTVVGRDVEPGEIIRPGTPLLTISDTNELELTVYVPLKDMGNVHAGQSASVRLPSLSGKTFAGRVTWLAQDAEFKPANVYNSEERSEIVFAARVTITNSEGDLKAGLPADATLQ